ncbi:hypothetical protein [Flagellimonas flava]|uniref:hypothetical protein n=1 Tax=Flagellimonas flava TaxID=570519 RepID=UPI003D64FCBE
MFDEDDENQRNSYESIRKMPIYQKGQEIFQLAEKISELVIDEEYNLLPEAKKSALQHHAQYLKSNAMMINPKMAGAIGADLYDIKMENAAIIRKAAREILTDSTGLKMHGFKHLEYLELLRNEVEQFRVLFAEWVKTFDPWSYIIDRWGLFNPPGVNYDDIDPDDDIPFDPEDYFND